MKKYRLLPLLLLFTACTSGFEEINTNPNAPIDVRAELLLRQVIYDTGEQMSYEAFVAGNLLGQYFAMIDFNLFDRHSLTEPQFGGNPWPILYQNLLDNEILIQKARANAADRVYLGPALILKAYLSAILTDLYGNVPYAEALQGEAGLVNPVYDSQESIYTAEGGILSNLEEAIQELRDYQGAIPLAGDVLFQGDLSAWTKFAQSLRIKYYMRLSQVSELDFGQELQQIYDTGDYQQDNGDNAVFDFTNGQPNNFRMATARVGDFNLFVMSETMEQILAGLDDPRLEVFFRPKSAGGLPRYRGLRNGPDASQTSISVSDYSLAGTLFREETGQLDANFMTAWESTFFLAEAAERGLIQANAKELYERGVNLAFAYWGAELPSDYLSVGPASYSTGARDPLEQIITQKWIANLLNGYEGWIEYRRTGFPALQAVQASLNEELIPVRMPYPTDEQALNSVNFNQAAEQSNGNSPNAPVWWDR